MSQPMFLILGCTASGKGAVAFELARYLNGDILSIDSMKVYRRMDIGTAKPSAERCTCVKHHLVDVVEPWESFSMGRYIDTADEAIAHIKSTQRPIIAVGGTAMYIRGLLEGIFDGPPANDLIRTRLKAEAQSLGILSLHQRLTSIDPAAAARIHQNDYKRIERALEVYELTGRPISSFQEQFRSGRYRYPWILIGLRRDKLDASHRINLRVKRMIDAGLVDEVKTLLSDPKGLSIQAGQAVGYAEIIDYLKGNISLEDAIERIKINSRHLAKSQRTWFRSFVGVNWFDIQPDDTVESVSDRIKSWLQDQKITVTSH